MFKRYGTVGASPGMECLSFLAHPDGDPASNISSTSWLSDGIYLAYPTLYNGGLSLWRAVRSGGAVGGFYTFQFLCRTSFKSATEIVGVSLILEIRITQARKKRCMDLSTL